MSGDRRYEGGLKPVEQRVTFRGRVRTNGAGAMDQTTRRPAFGVTITRTDVGLATAQLTENDGTAARFDEIEFAAFTLQVAAAPGAAGAYLLRPLVVNETTGTVTLRCEDSAGAAVEFPATDANSWLHWDIEAKYTTTDP